MEKLQHDDLILTVEEKGEDVIVKWIGDSRAMDPASKLDPFLNNIVMTIKEKKLVVDFRELNSMNSSTVLPILTFIKALEASSVHTEIIYDGSKSWQKASFIPLSAVTKFYKYIKVNNAREA